MLLFGCIEIHILLLLDHITENLLVNEMDELSSLYIIKLYYIIK